MVEIKHRQTQAVIHTVGADTLRGCVIKGKELRYADLRNADLSGCRIEGCSLSEANLHSANLTCARFIDCVLQRADLSNSILVSADFSDCVLGRQPFSKRDSAELQVSSRPAQPHRIARQQLFGMRFLFCRTEISRRQRQ